MSVPEGIEPDQWLRVQALHAAVALTRQVEWGDKLKTEAESMYWWLKEFS